MSADKGMSKKSLGSMPSFRKTPAKKSDAAAKSGTTEPANNNDEYNNNDKTTKSSEKPSPSKTAADDQTTEKPAKKTETRGRKRRAEADPADKETPAKKQKTTKKTEKDAEKTPKKSPKGGKTQKGSKTPKDDEKKLTQSKLNFGTKSKKSPKKAKDDEAMDVDQSVEEEDMSDDDNNFEIDKDESDDASIESADEEEPLEPVPEPKQKRSNNNNDTATGDKDQAGDVSIRESEAPPKKETRGRPKKGEVRIPKKYVKKGRQPKAPKVWTPDNHAKEMSLQREEMKKSIDTNEFLFQKWIPNIDEIKEAIIKDAKEYLPETKQSLQFCYRSEKTDSEPQTLKTFDAIERAKNGNNHKDLMINVGGPVWALDWCPRQSADEEDQYLAVGAYKTDDYHVFSKPYSGKHVLQIWSFGKLTKSGAPAKPYMAMGIAHEGGFVWDLHWCPRGSPVTQKLTGTAVPRLGLLAAASGDGSLRVYSVPDPQHLHTSLGQQYPLILKLKPVYEVTLPFPSLIWRCEWNYACNLLATGCTDGTVAVFKPSDTNIKTVTNTIPPPLKPVTTNFETCLGSSDVKEEPDEVTLSNMNTVSLLSSRKMPLSKIPIAYFTAHRTCALVQWGTKGAPKDLLVSMGDAIKFWDLKNPSCPLLQQTFGTKIANSITFGSSLSTVIGAFDDGSVRYLDPTGMNRQFVYHNAAIWTGDHSLLLEQFATCDANGVIKTMPTNGNLKHSRLASTSFPKPVAIERMLYEDSILKFATNEKLARQEYDSLNELTGNDDESDEEEKPKKKSKAKAKKSKKDDDGDEDDKETNNNNNNNNTEDSNKKPKKLLLDPLKAFHRVKWNSNYSACNWIAYAGKAGLLRCQAIDWVVQ